MADFPTARRPKRPGFANAEWREIIMEHERSGVLAFQRIDSLLIISCPKRDDGQALRFAAGKQGRAMRTRQYTDFTRDWTDISRSTAVGARSLFENHVADFRVFQAMKDNLDMALAIRVVRVLELIDRLLEDQIQPFLASRLVGDHDGIPDPLCHKTFHLSSQIRSDLLRDDRSLGLVARK